MLTFLRKLRQHQPSGTRYLTYAIGEILLVVLGILIALAINNWNEKRKTAEKRKVLTEKLIQELHLTETYCMEAVQGIDDQIGFLRYVLSDWEEFDLNQKKARTDFDLSVLFYMSSFSRFFDPPSEIYNAALSDGSIQLIRDQQLQQVLGEFHQSSVARINQFIEEEYALGREINQYIAERYGDIFKGGITNTSSVWSKQILSNLLNAIKIDGTLRYKIAERIEIKSIRKRFIESWLAEDFQSILSNPIN